MKVLQLMTPNVETCHPQDNLAVAAQKLWDHDIGALPVVGVEQVLGMITDRDICMAAYTQGLLLTDIPASTAMSKKVFFCKPGDSIIDAEETMRSHQVRRLPVLEEDGKLVGIISLNDIAREAEREVGQKGREISPPEVTSTLASVCQPRQSGRLEAAH